MSGFAPAFDHNIPASHDEPGQLMVACQFAKADHQRWPKCDYRPWTDIRSFIRHHVIGSHRTSNARLLKKGHRDAVSEQLFVELAQWSSCSKDWKTLQQQRQRWNEVFDIIAKWLNIARPHDLDPTWTRTWVREVLNEGEAVETVCHAIADDGVRRLAQVLVDRINDKKRALAWLDMMNTQCVGAIFENQQELENLKTELTNTVRLSGFESEFLSQIEPDGSAESISRDFGFEHKGIPVLGDSFTITDPRHDHLMQVVPEMLLDLDTSNVDTPMGNAMGDTEQSSSRNMQQLSRSNHKLPLYDTSAGSDGSSETHSMQHTLQSFDTPHYSTNPTSLDGPGDYQAWSGTKDMEYRQSYVSDGIGNNNTEQFPIGSARADLTYTGMLADSDLDLTPYWNLE